MNTTTVITGTLAIAALAFASIIPTVATAGARPSKGRDASPSTIPPVNGASCTVDFMGAASEDGTWHNYGGVWACDTSSGSYARTSEDPDDTFENGGVGTIRANGDPCTVDFLGAASEAGTWHNYGGVWACDTSSGSYARTSEDPDDTFENGGVGTIRVNGESCTVDFQGAASEDGTWHNYGGVWACDTASGSYA